MKVEIYEVYKEINKQIREHLECVSLCESREDKLLYQSAVDGLRELKRTLVRKYRSPE